MPQRPRRHGQEQEILARPFFPIVHPPRRERRALPWHGPPGTITLSALGIRLPDRPVRTTRRSRRTSVVRTGGIRALRSALVRCPAVVGAIALASIVAGCRGSGAVPPDPASLATKVKVVVAQPRTVEDASEYVATIKSRSSVTLQPQVEGQITRIFVKSGDRVEAGAPILQIDPLKQSATVSSQDATRKAKLATLDWTRSPAGAGRRASSAQGITSKADLDQAQTAYDAAQADLSSLEAQVKEQEVQLKYYGVTRAHGRHRRRRAGARGRPCHDLDPADDDRPEDGPRGLHQRPARAGRRRCGSGRRSRSSTATGRCWRSPG